MLSVDAMILRFFDQKTPRTPRPDWSEDVFDCQLHDARTAVAGHDPAKSRIAHRPIGLPSRRLLVTLNASARNSIYRPPRRARELGEPRNENGCAA
jgi:hypothetical protein